MTKESPATLGINEIERFRRGDILLTDEQANSLCDLAISALSEIGDRGHAAMADAFERARQSRTEEGKQVDFVEISGEPLLELIRLLRSAPSARRCKWTLDTDGIYQTGCGNHFCYTDGTRTECTAKFCQACGGEIEGDE